MVSSVRVARPCLILKFTLPNGWTEKEERSFLSSGIMRIFKVLANLAKLGTLALCLQFSSAKESQVTPVTAGYAPEDACSEHGLASVLLPATGNQYSRYILIGSQELLGASLDWGTGRPELLICVPQKVDTHA